MTEQLIERLAHNVTPAGEVPKPEEPTPAQLWQEKCKRFDSHLDAFVDRLRQLKPHASWIEEIHENRKAHEERNAVLAQEGDDLLAINLKLREQHIDEQEALKRTREEHVLERKRLERTREMNREIEVKAARREGRKVF